MSEEHLDAISNTCRKQKYIISIRETGALSVKRINEGAKAKPHTILEKSIKGSSIENGYKDRTEDVLQKLGGNGLDILGFVGHWNSEGKLVGLRVDGYDDGKTLLKGKSANILFGEQGITVEKIQKGGAYIPLDLDKEDGLKNIQKLQNIPEYAKVLYTGDYDLHEAYTSQGGTGGLAQIREGSPEKAQLLNDLNAGIAKSSAHNYRTGNAQVGKDGLIHGRGSYAMFQHGDQATYRTNQLMEAFNAEKEKLKQEGKIIESKRLQPGKAEALLVRAVATESDEPMAWCIQGKWYVTNNKIEHDLLREAFNLHKPSTWLGEQEARRHIEQFK